MVEPWPLFVLAMALSQKSLLADQFLSERIALPVEPVHDAASVSVVIESTAKADTTGEKESFIFILSSG